MALTVASKLDDEDELYEEFVDDSDSVDCIDDGGDDDDDALLVVAADVVDDNIALDVIDLILSLFIFMNRRQTRRQWQ